MRGLQSKRPALLPRMLARQVSIRPEPAPQYRAPIPWASGKRPPGGLEPLQAADKRKDAPAHDDRRWIAEQPGERPQQQRDDYRRQGGPPRDPAHAEAKRDDHAEPQVPR